MQEACPKYTQPKEMTVLCSSESKSILRASSLEALNSFTWEKLSSELSAKAPTLYAVLDACVNVKRRGKVTPESKSRHSSRHAVLGMCAAIILRNRHHHMNLVQRIVSLILHGGHSAKQVSVINALYLSFINPRRACAARVTVVVPCVCVCVCVSKAFICDSCN